MLLCGCAEPEPLADPGTTADQSVDPAEDIAPARYLTHIVFAGIDGTAFFGSFMQDAQPDRLEREYRVWLGDDAGWTALLAVNDTLPIPRAAWRILPAGAMTVRVGDARQVVGLAFRTPGGRFALHAGEEVAVWTGPTGQRESVGVAAIETGDRQAGGVLYFRRAARALRYPSQAGDIRAFVLTDSVGNGLLIEQSEADGTAVARTWLHGAAAAWDAVALAPDTTAAGLRSPRWTFDIPGAGLRGTIRAVSTPTGTPVPTVRIECELTADGEVFPFVGVVAPLPLP